MEHDSSAPHTLVGRPRGDVATQIKADHYDGDDKGKIGHPRYKQ